MKTVEELEQDYLDAAEDGSYYVLDRAYKAWQDKLKEEQDEDS